MTINNFLVYLTGVGVVAVISWLFEGWNWYQNLVGRTKQIVFYAACAVVAIAAQLVIVLVPTSVITILAPYFAILATLFINIFAGTGFHSLTKMQGSAKVAKPPLPVEEPVEPTPESPIQSKPGE